MSLSNLFHTVKYLKLSQIYYRILKKLIHPSPHELIAQRRVVGGNWVIHSLYEQKLFNNNRVLFLNKEGHVNSADDWNDKLNSKLWLYNLHYFDDLNALGAEERKDQQVKLIIKWIDENPAPIGNGWEPYPTSLRIVNWIKAFLSHVEPNQKMLNSLGQQADYLSQDLEYHLLGNHLFVNAKALIFAGLYLNGTHAKNWLSTGLSIYEKQLKEQVLTDGGNFELSPMYHVIMLVDLLDCLNIFKAFSDQIDSSIVDHTKDKANKMVHWLGAMSHNDNQISFFNDSAMGIAPKNSIVQEYAKKLGLKIEINKPQNTENLLFNDLSNTGYVSVKSNNFTLIADLAEVGPSYQPGHAHADTLSFELALFGQRIFVNSGISEYGLSKERLRQRKAAAHNTVVVNGLDSTQVWSGFRVAKRANILGRNVEKRDDGSIFFFASHNGFKKQGVNCIHRRSWKVSFSEIIISDFLIGEFESAYSYLHLHPLIEVINVSINEVKLLFNDYVITLIVSNAQVSVESSTWHPEFGITQDNKKICFEFMENSISINISWALG